MSKRQSFGYRLIYLCISFFIFTGSLLIGQTTVFINEIHYDNGSTDVGEAIEKKGPTYTAVYYITCSWWKNLFGKLQTFDKEWMEED